MANYPGSLDNLDRPESANTLATNHHASMHQAEEEAIEALEAKVGISNSQVAGTHEKRINDLSAAVAALQAAAGTGGGGVTPPGATVAALTVSPTQGTFPFLVTANASASVSGAGIRTYAFNWGDGATTAAQPGATATHTFATAGVFTVQVTVTDANGATSIATGTVTSNAPGAAGVDLIVTSITASPAAPIAGDAVTFTVTVKNQGSTAIPAGQAVGQNIGVGFYVDTFTGTPPTYTNYSGGLASGASFTQSCTAGWSFGGTWTATVGTHTVRAWANDAGAAAITETNFNNNTLDMTLTVVPVGSSAVVVDRGTVNSIVAGTTLTSANWTPAQNSLIVVVVEGTTI